MREQDGEATGKGKFLRDFWYIGAWASEVTRKPMRRLIMNEPILFYRREDASVVALEDRCPHRNYPLSRGDLRGDTIQCGYHGLTIASDGRCIHAPGQERPPSAAKIRAYPVAEQNGIVWIHMGDPILAASQALPNLDWLTDPAWTPWIDGYIYLRCRDQLLTENLLDISHIAYVHKRSMGSDPERIVSAETSVTTTQTGVSRRVRIMNIATPNIFSASALVKDRVDQWTESWMTPGLYQNHTRIRSAASVSWESDAEAPLQNRSFHGIVPETDTTTHYFHGGARLNVDVETITGERAHQVLEEDVAVLEAIQQNEQFVDGRPLVNLRNDATVMQWRGVLRSLQAPRAA